MKQLQIRMLGGFSLEAGENRIADTDNRSRKVWLLLAYLLCHRNRTVSPSELIELIWGGEPASDNPENALKVTLHRARSLLDKLWPGAGHDLILRQNGGYRWNGDADMTVDAQQFEDLCSRQTLDDALQALALYQGEFLGRQASGAWVIPIAAHYHNLYIRTVLFAVPELMAQERWQQAAALCRSAIAAEPYNEPLHRMLMTALIAQEDMKGAADIYEALSQRLFHDFGITPGEELRTLYRTASHNKTDRSMPMDTVLEHLLESDPEAGALQCSFDCFKVLCHAEARAMLRSGSATHVALLSVTGQRDKELSKRSLERAMANLGQQIRVSLRRGDAFSKCTASQYVIMLPRANYENSCVVCRRVIDAFYRRHPHSPTSIHYMVQPLSNPQLDR